MKKSRGKKVWIGWAMQEVEPETFFDYLNKGMCGIYPYFAIPKEMNAKKIRITVEAL